MTQPEKALVFDDEPDVANLVVSQLTMMGFDAHGTTTESDFLGTLSQLRPRLIILDLSLGKTDAVDILNRIQYLKYDGRVVLMSGHDQSILAHTQKIGTAFGLTMAGYVRKPFRMLDLQKVVLRSERKSTPRFNEQTSPNNDTHFARAALDNNWIEFWYQPKIDLATGLTVGAEALARVRHPTRGVLSPASFLPGATSDDMHDLTILALETACSAARRIRTDGRIMEFSINVPGNILTHIELFDDIREVVSRLAVEAPLVLELTETDIIADKELARAFATRAILNGFRVSIDDFGHGYATFERLRSVPFSELKLDRSIVNGCALDPEALALCRAGVEIARGFNATIVAEGIENADDLAVVRSLGFNTAQGYLYSPAVPLEEFRRLPFDSFRTIGASPI